MKKRCIGMTVIAVMMGMHISAAYAADMGTEAEYTYGTEETFWQKQEYLYDGGMIQLPTGVTQDMCKASYWYDKALANSTEVMLSLDEIEKLNQISAESSSVKIVDVESLLVPYDASELRLQLLSESVPGNTMYVNGKPIHNKTYFWNMKVAMEKTCYTGTMNSQPAVCTTRTNLTAWPTDDILGYSETDPDNELQNGDLLVNEPFVIRQKCDINGQTYYWGYSNRIYGWVNSKNIAICSNKEEWLDAWKVELKGNDFIIVAQDKIVTEASALTPYSSEVKLTLGTCLKLIPKDEIPDNIGDRGLWNNYVVYLPTRNADGMYEKKPALISQHYHVNIGYVPCTEKNLLDLAFACLGNRYGWCGMLDSMDCSLFTRTIYRCCGLEIPRSSTWQQFIPDTMYSMVNMTDKQKSNFISTLPAGTLLYFPGHTMVYVGTIDGTNYVISSTDSLSDSSGALNVHNEYSCILTPLTVRRPNGRTWLNNLTAAVVFPKPNSLKDCQKNVTADCSQNQFEVSLTYQGVPLYEGINYEIMEREDGTVELYGINNFCDSIQLSEEMRHDFTNGIVKELPTIEQPGYEIRTCAVCGKIYRHPSARLNSPVGVFDDISPTGWYLNGIAWALDNHITNGTSAQTFSPDQTCTRAQVISLLWRANGQPKMTNVKNPFRDVRETDYFYHAVLWGIENNITTGVSADTFGANLPCTRAQVMTFLYRAAEDHKINASQNPFGDVEKDQYYFQPILWAVERGVTNGTSSTTFSPNKTCVRAEVVTFLYRYYA